jgi:circadian clock protein KaiB
MMPSPSKRPPRRCAAVLREFDLVLYIGGATRNSRLALLNIKDVGERFLEGRYRLSVVDLFQQPEQARTHKVLAVPMLVRTWPLPMRRMIGDLSSERRVMIGLGLAAAPAPALLNAT